MTEHMLDVAIFVVWGGLLFGIGYIYACWNKLDEYEEQLEELSQKHKEIIKRLKDELHNDTWWKGKADEERGI